jgi:chaperonin cofactor prefoldin
MRRKSNKVGTETSAAVAQSVASAESQSTSEPSHGSRGERLQAKVDELTAKLSASDKHAQELQAKLRERVSTGAVPASYA